MQNYIDIMKDERWVILASLHVILPEGPQDKLIRGFGTYYQNLH